jgi:hypothetical protein
MRRWSIVTSEAFQPSCRARCGECEEDRSGLPASRPAARCRVHAVRDSDVYWPYSICICRRKRKYELGGGSQSGKGSAACFSGLRHRSDDHRRCWWRAARLRESGTEPCQGGAARLRESTRGVDCLVHLWSVGIKVRRLCLNRPLPKLGDTCGLGSRSAERLTYARHINSSSPECSWPSWRYMRATLGSCPNADVASEGDGTTPSIVTRNGEQCYRLGPRVHLQ